MHVLFMNPSGQLGGAETGLLSVIASLRVEYPDWKLSMLAVQHGPFISQVKHLGVDVHVIPLPPALAVLGDAGLSAETSIQRWLTVGWQGIKAVLPLLKFLMRLHRQVKKLNPHLIHTNGFKMHILGLWSRPAHVPLVWHLQDYVGQRPLMRLLCRWHISSCQAVIAISKSVAEDLASACGRVPRIAVVHSAVSTAQFHPEGSALNLAFLSGLDPEEPGTVRIGLLGTFAHWKGHDVFLQALTQVRTTTPWRAYVVGDAIYQTGGSQHSRQQLSERVCALQLQNRVGFTGFVSDTASALRALDVVVHTSTRPEPFGMVIIEAQATGKAVLVARAGGAAEIVDEEENALAAAPGDVAGIAAALSRLINDAPLRERLGRGARTNAETRFSMLRLGRQVGETYQEMTAHACPTRR